MAIRHKKNAGGLSVLDIDGKTIDPSGAVAGQALIYDSVTGKFVPGSSLSPFHFRLDPTSTAAFGTPRASSGSPPAVTTGTDTAGRKYVRFTANTSNPSVIPITTPALSLTGRFRIEMRANWGTGQGASQRVGICWNLDPASGFTWFGVGNASAGGASFDSDLDGTAENFTTFSARQTDASYEYSPLHVEVFIDSSTGYCTYTYGGQPFYYGAFQQRRKTALRTSGKFGLGLWSQGNTGTLDIAELLIWKNERDW